LASRELEGSSRLQQGKFKRNEQRKMKTLIRSINRSPLRCGFFTLAIALCWFALSPPLKAQDCPSTCPGGGNTGVGVNALDSVLPGTVNNTAVGIEALTNDTTGDANVAVGHAALAKNTHGNFNMAIGSEALANNIVGNFNMGIGFRALFMNTGNRNSAIGAAALRNNAGASDNTAIGSEAMRENQTGEQNTAIGAQALNQNIDGRFNDAVGAGALRNNTGGFGNNAFGNSALFSNQTGSENTAIGDVALAFNDSSGNGLANNNTAVGGAALESNTDGSENTAVGTGAGQNVINGFNNTYVGDFVGTLAPDESSTIRIGDLSNGNGSGSLACFIGGIFNNFQPVGGSVVEVTIDLATDELGWDVGPSQRGSAPAAPRSAPLRRIAPGAPAQRSAMLNGKVGKVEKLEATVAQLKFAVAKQEATILQQKKDFQAIVSHQQKRIDALTAGLEKVSAQLEASKPAPKVVANK
jgi:hypothetical protein